VRRFALAFRTGAFLAALRGAAFRAAGLRAAAARFGAAALCAGAAFACVGAGRDAAGAADTDAVRKFDGSCHAHARVTTQRRYTDPPPGRTEASCNPPQD